MSDMIIPHIVNGSRLEPDEPHVCDRNPAHPDRVVARWGPADPATVTEACAAAHLVNRDWRRWTPRARAQVLERAADSLSRQMHQLATELTAEEGKPLVEACGEVGRAIRVLRYYAAEADRPSGHLFASSRPGEQVVARHVPLGAVALITPWNFPLAIPAWKIAPALVFGNTVVWKPSPVTPVTAMRLTEALMEAGLPPGVVNLVLGDADVAANLLADPRIVACSFTGSTAAGRSVMGVGAQRGIKTQAEMGGVNVAVVLADADLDRAAARVTAGAFGSSGQKCTATSIVIVEEGVKGPFMDRLLAQTTALVVGDPMEESTDLGPLATARQRDLVGRTLAEAKKAGGTIVLDGTDGPLPNDGWFVGPSIVTDLAPDHPLLGQEVFGPLLFVLGAQDAEESFALADRRPYGLTASVFTTSLASSMTAPDSLHTGVVHINSETTGAEPNVPFGGIGASGAGGRELGRAARDFYTETQTVYVA